MTVQYYTYLYYDPKDGTPIYAGKGHKRRARCHKRQRNNNRLFNLIQKRISEGYSVDPIIINMPSEAEALQLEIFWIMYYGRADLGLGTLFNLTDGGDGNQGQQKGIKRSQETKDKIGRANKGKPRTQEQRDHLSRLYTGRKQSPETIAKRAKTQTGRKHTPEQCKAISERLKGCHNPKKGMSYEEIYGIEKANRIREKKRIAMQRKNAEKEANTESQTT